MEKRTRFAPSPTKVAISKIAADPSYTKNRKSKWRDGRLARPHLSRAGTPGLPPLSGFLTSNRLTMRLNRKLNRVLFVLALYTICIAPAYGANKDIVELQTQVTQLQQQMTQMKQSFDERMGVMRNLLEKNTDAANKVSAAVGELQTSITNQQQDRSGHD